MPNQVAAEVVGERYTRLHAHQEAISASVNAEAIGRTMKVLVAEVSGRRNGDNDRMIDITESSSHYLIGTGGKVERRAKREAKGTMLGIPVIRA
jgi:tRNA-2-methylthio-N6-dimethylallyladenosine synthase